jgi:uncharacterized protein DUF4238
MSSRDHYVSQFHLRGFTDPTATKPQEPWLWVGDCATGSIKRRSPKNVAWSTDLFAGPGGLADREASIETYLSTHVESPAAFALRGFVSRPSGTRTAVPAAVGRYLAWAAARSVSMRDLYQAWIDDLPDPAESEDVERLRRDGWRFVLGNEDFLELVHLQAWYFQVRFFPRLRWVILDAPPGGHFIIGDRPVVWGFDGMVDAQPRALRHSSVQLFATLTRSTALFAYHPLRVPPDGVSFQEVNRVIALAAVRWIAGPTRSVVEASLAERTRS